MPPRRLRTVIALVLCVSVVTGCSAKSRPNSRSYNHPYNRPYVPPHYPSGGESDSGEDYADRAEAEDVAKTCLVRAYTLHTTVHGQVEVSGAAQEACWEVEGLLMAGKHPWLGDTGTYREAPRTPLSCVLNRQQMTAIVHDSDPAGDGVYACVTLRAAGWKEDDAAEKALGKAPATG